MFNRWSWRGRQRKHHETARQTAGRRPAAGSAPAAETSAMSPTGKRRPDCCSHSWPSQRSSQTTASRCELRCRMCVKGTLSAQAGDAAACRPFRVNRRGRRTLPHAALAACSPAELQALSVSSTIRPVLTTESSLLRSRPSDTAQATNPARCWRASGANTSAPPSQASAAVAGGSAAASVPRRVAGRASGRGRTPRFALAEEKRVQSVLSCFVATVGQEATDRLLLCDGWVDVD